MEDLFRTDLLRQVADLDALPVGAYNIRANGQSAARSTTSRSSGVRASPVRAMPRLRAMRSKRRASSLENGTLGPIAPVSSAASTCPSERR